MAKFKYTQLANSLKSNILEGLYQPGKKIPTEPELSELFAVSRHTVRMAVSLLEEEGFLRRIQGSGTYVMETLPKTSDPRERTALSNVIGLVLMDTQNYIFSSIVHGASDYLMSHGYLLSTILTSGSYDSEKQALETLQSSHPAGILLEPASSGLHSVNYDLFQQVAKHIPCLLLHSDDIGICRSLSLQDRLGAQMLTDYLIGLGHSKIGTLFCFDEHTGQQRYCGYLDSLRSHGLIPERDLSLWAHHEQAKAFFDGTRERELDQMLRQVTAVICQDDRAAHALIRCLAEKGIRVPEDISVVGYDDSFYATLDLPITTVSHPKAEYGRHAAQALLEMIRSPEGVDLSQYTVTPELIIRKSAAAPAGSGTNNTPDV